MTVQNSATLKGYFDTNDKPTQSQFGDLVDTVLDASTHSVTSTGAPSSATLATRFSYVINVKDDYGAVGDNTTDDTTAFQNALDAMPTKGAVIFVPPGVYLISSSLVWPAADTSTLVAGALRGPNAGPAGGAVGSVTEGLAVLNFTGASGALLEFRDSGAAGTRNFAGAVENLKLVGADTSGTQGINLYDCKNAIFRNLTVVNFQDGIVVANDSFYSTWDDLVVLSCTRYGVHFQGLINGSGIGRSNFSSNGTNGLRLENAGRPIKLDGCWFESNTGAGLFVDETIGVELYNCYFENNGSEDIDFQNYSAVADYDARLLCAGCYFNPGAGDNIIAVTSTADIILIACEINSASSPGAAITTTIAGNAKITSIGCRRGGSNSVSIHGAVNSLREFYAFDCDLTNDEIGIRNYNPTPAARNQKIQAFEFWITNAAGTLQHRFVAEGSGAQATEWADQITGSTSTFTNSPTGANASTAMAGGGKISSSSTNEFIFDTAAVTDLNIVIGPASIAFNSTGTDLTAQPVTRSLNVNGTTRNRFHLAFWNTAAGAAFALTTGNIASGKSIAVRVLVYLP